VPENRLAGARLVPDAQPLSFGLGNPNGLLSNWEMVEMILSAESATHKPRRT
jgi:hypothetical protein